MMLANGDSHTAGQSLSDNDTTFSQHVANHFGLELTNYAVGGSSNTKILRTSLDAIESLDLDFVLIGWTTWEREEWLINGTYYHINASGTIKLPTAESRQKYKEWISKLSQDNLILKSREWYYRIFDFHKQLENLKIPHLFFNAFHPFMLNYKQPTKDWGDNFLWPEKNNNGTYYSYCKEVHNCEPVDSHYHLGPDAHRIWADILIKHIEEHDLIR